MSLFVPSSSATMGPARLLAKATQTVIREAYSAAQKASCGFRIRYKRTV